MKIILISIEESPSLFFSIIQEILINKGHESKYLHLQLNSKINDEKLSRITRQLKEFCEGAGLICISCMTYSFIAFTRLAKKIKKFNIPIIVGGIHPTIRPEECLDYADYVCVGEGEDVIPELANRLEKNKRTDDIKNIWLKKNGKIVKNKLRPLIKDLGKLPVPTFKFENLFLYYNEKINCLADDKNKELIKRYYHKYYYINTSRGCSFKCKYCQNNCLIKIDPKFALIRRRSTRHIIQELKNAKKVLPKDTIIGIVDDDFCSQPYDSLKEFCQIYKKEIEMPFFCSAIPSVLIEEKIKELVGAGLIRLEVGIQSINEKINIELYGRHTSKYMIKRVTKMLEKYRKKFQICYDFILDNPWENDRTQIESLEFIMSLKKPVTILLFSLTLYPKTDLYKKAKSEGMIKNEYSEIYRKNHMLLENNPINSLFVLYTRYNFPKIIIGALIRLRKIPIIKQFLNRSTSFLWRGYNYYAGLKDSIKREDKEMRDYYLKAPFKKILNIK